MYKFLQTFALLLLFHSPAAFAMEIPLEYVKDGEDENFYYRQGLIDGWFSNAAPSGDWKLPLFKSKKPLYAFLNLGDRQHLMVLDVEKRGLKISTTLHVDYNGNRDLTDDNPVVGPSRGWESIFFGSNNSFISNPLDFTVMEKGVSRPYCLKLELLVKNLGRKGFVPAFRWIPHCRYRAVITAGRKYTIILADNNHNARFGDQTIYESPQNSLAFLLQNSQGDYFYLSDNDAINYREQLPLNEIFVLENKTYRLSLDFAARKLILSEIVNDLAPLKLAMIPDRLSLLDINNKRNVNVYYPSDLTIMLPAGNYRLDSYRISRKDDNGNLWCLTSGSGKFPTVTVAEGKSPSLVFGEPYLVNAEILTSRQMFSRGWNISMKISAEGQGKENIDRVTFFKVTRSSPQVLVIQRKDNRSRHLS